MNNDKETVEVSVELKGIDEVIEKLNKIKKLLNEIAEINIQIEVK